MLAVSVSKNLIMMVITRMVMVMMIIMTKYLDPLTTRAARRLGKMYLKHLEALFVIIIIIIAIITINIINLIIIILINSTCCYPSESLCNGEVDRRPGIAQLPQR